MAITNIITDAGWQVEVLVDEDGHLNLYVTNRDCVNVDEVDTGQGDGRGEQYALRCTTSAIEKRHRLSEGGSDSRKD